jgi:NADH-quinone oxidoreductase subunit G
MIKKNFYLFKVNLVDYTIDNFLENSFQSDGATIISNFFWIFLNDYLYFFIEEVPLIQALHLKNIFLPRFCYFSKLKIAGNCRICIIEELDILKPVIACGTLIDDEGEYYTHTAVAFNGREHVMELLLLNHPIDCPICDQAGECDPQDQSMIFGNITSRQNEKIKKNIKDKYLLNTIKINLNKCINCTRCTRYLDEIIGESGFSLLGRGEFSEISNYIDNPIKSYIKLIGNVIDLCPVSYFSKSLFIKKKIE